MKKAVIYFATLAMNQTVFFSLLARELTKRGCTVKFICFDEKSYSYLSSKGFLAFNVYKDMLSFKETESDALEKYSVENVDNILIHEKAYYRITDFALQRERLSKYLSVISSYLKLENPENTFLIQEFGGFISVASCFYAARYLGIDNIFIEPSFYKGTVFLQKNTYCAKRIIPSKEVNIEPGVASILDSLVENKPIVIPDKDKHHYRSVFSKLFDFHNIKRLLQKIIYKYILRRNEEFQYIWVHVSRHIQMALNKLRIGNRYISDITSSSFYYYPLHVPNDASLTIRSPDYFNQIEALKKISSYIPEGSFLYIKEHPALVGAYDFNEMKDLLNSCKNIRILRPDINNYDVVTNCEAMITVNSKAGAEALLLGKHVVVLGDAFYRLSDDVIICESIGDLPKILTDIKDKKHVVDIKRVRNYFQKIWDESYLCELYTNADDNVKKFTDAILKEVRDR